MHLESRCDWSAFCSRLLGATGSSVGSLFALLLVCGASPHRVMAEWPSGGFVKVATQFDPSRLYNEFGLDKGDELRRIIHFTMSLCGVSGDVTLEGLHRLIGKRLVVCCTKLDEARRVCMDHASHPDVRVADALYMSMTLPVLVRPMECDGSIMVDGCMTCVVPGDVFPPRETLCLRITDRGGMPPRAVCRFAHFAYALLKCNFVNQERLGSEHDDAFALSLRIPVPSTHNFDLSLDADTVRDLSRCGHAVALGALHPGLHEAIGGLSRILGVGAAALGEPPHATVDGACGIRTEME
jgi:hypothetical protein